MKSLFIFSFLISVSSFALGEVKRIGQFVPSQCRVYESVRGATSEVVAVKNVCWGELAHMNQPALEIQTNDGAVLVYKVKITKEDARVGSTTRKFVGTLSNSHSKNTTLKRDRVEGQISMVVVPNARPKLSFKTDSNLVGDYELETVFVTQSL